MVVLFAIAANDLARDGADDQAAFLLEALSRAGYGKERWERSEKKPIWLAWIDAMDELEVLKDAVPDELQRQAFAQAVVLFAKDTPIERVDELHGMLSNLLLIPEDGYPVDSGSPNILWFGDFLGFCNRVNNHLVSRRIHGYRLLDEPIEEFASAFGFAAVETEGELVQV